MSPEQEPLKSGQKEFVTFTSGDQSFCLEIMQIKEIRRWAQVTALPHAPEDVMGVMNLRGSVIPIYDLAARFGFGKTEANERNVVIIATVGDQTIGLLVQSVSEILTVPLDAIQETPDVKSEATRQSIIGVISREDDMTRVIDLKAVIAPVERLAS
ncbi:chemotaxis protein CheW [Algirhabdus cladophorae]|uniref:chemotaxis protein CheW n=1 Tax=Algirhabdus cladophorae TaxID=3377108 RepID=UPI003B8492ED